MVLSERKLTAVGTHAKLLALHRVHSIAAAPVLLSATLSLCVTAVAHVELRLRYTNRHVNPPSCELIACHCRCAMGYAGATHILLQQPRPLRLLDGELQDPAFVAPLLETAQVGGIAYIAQLTDAEP